MTGRLRYNPRTQRYGITKSDLWEKEGLSSGHFLEWYDVENHEWIPDKLESRFPSNRPSLWYFAISGLEGEELEGLEVRIVQKRE